MACHQSMTDAMNAAEVRSSSPETRERIRKLQEADRGLRAELEEASTADGASAPVARMISP